MREAVIVSVAGMTIGRCSSGLISIATVANPIVCDGAQVIVAGGCVSIRFVKHDTINSYLTLEPTVKAYRPAKYMPMLNTAEVVAERDNISRAAQGAYALNCRQAA